MKDFIRIVDDEMTGIIKAGIMFGMEPQFNVGEWAWVVKGDGNARIC